MGLLSYFVNPMLVYTFQLSKWRQVKAMGIPYLDTTVKTGNCVQVAPYWDMVMGVKKGLITQEEYTKLYNEIVDYWFFQDPLFWDWLLGHPILALGCYCEPGKFCHRHLLVQFLKRVTDVTEGGELFVNNG